MKYLVCRTDEISDSQYRHYFSLMPPERQQKCLAYRKDSDKKLCIAAYILLCRLCKTDTVNFTYDKNGKPIDPDGKFFFSLSHSGSYAAAVLSDAEVGIDIEEIRPVSPSVFRRVCTEREMSLLSEDDPLEFLKIWTFKEAYFKRIGIGLSGGLKNVDICDYINLLTVECTDKYILTII